MSSWRPTGWPNTTSWRHDDDPAATLAAPTHGGAGYQYQASQQFPVPEVTAAVASYLASQPPPPAEPHPHPTLLRAPVGIVTSQPPPRRRTNYAPLQQWAAAPRYQQRVAPRAAPWPWVPTFAPPAPSHFPSSTTTAPPVPSHFPSSTTTAPPGVMLPGGTTTDYGASSGGGGGGAAGEDAPGCVRVARRAAREAAGEGRNFLLSPLSLHAALALVAAGTGGQTQRELLGFLGAGSLQSLQRAAATRLVGALRGLPQTSFACGVWVDRRQALRPEFAEVAGAVYGAVAESVDFVSQAEEARQRVNALVSDTTKGLIREILPPRSLDSSTVVVLANALYFKGTWALPFDPQATFTAPFHLADGTTVSASFMTTSMFKEQHQVAVFPGFKALKLPYKNDDDWSRHDAALFYMLLLLPDGGGAPTVTDLFDKASSTPGFVRAHTPAAKAPVGRFMVPKFKFSFEFEASGDIQRLGVTRAFGGGDFSGMVAGGDGLFIKAVYHKAAIEVDELGTVAAAATAVCICQSGSAWSPVDFVADRPFVFAIAEERSGAVMFLGHVVNPLVG